MDTLICLQPGKGREAGRWQEGGRTGQILTMGKGRKKGAQSDAEEGTTAVSLP